MKFKTVSRIGVTSAFMFVTFGLISLCMALYRPADALTRVCVGIWFVVPPLYTIWENWILDRDADPDDRAYIARCQDLGAKLWLGIAALLYFILKT